MLIPEVSNTQAQATMRLHDAIRLGGLSADHYAKSTHGHVVNEVWPLLLSFVGCFSSMGIPS